MCISALAIFRKYHKNITNTSIQNLKLVLKKVKSLKVYSKEFIAA